ncbi:ATP-binding cassette domain-containing protein [Thiohalorhabdus denitrificans]|uniref:ABC transporter n=1 Tax=Thiohalorhabdus denitrificans TaxID=381306 RepID=A0A1G5BX30_9GAMM|nr:ATP-binding cassette domain-containing protein [Thiohalorhabdus denitrificans]SCX94594.1 ABC transporter [Thiohalorhabdus denitrificans]
MARATVQHPEGTGNGPAPGERGTAPLVTAEEAVVGYERPVLGPLSFRVRPGDVVGVWGPNGAGKSTLLKAIAGAARVHRGRLERPPDLRLAYQAQRPARLAEMPVKGRELLAVMQADDRRPPERLRPWLEQRLDRLSGGQLQLLTIWACLASGARLVLLDEPSNNLDPEGIDLLVELLGARAAGEAVLVVSHEAPFLERVATRHLEVGA